MSPDSKLTLGWEIWKKREFPVLTEAEASSANGIQFSGQLHINLKKYTGFSEALCSVHTSYKHTPNIMLTYT